MVEFKGYVQETNEVCQEKELHLRFLLQQLTKRELYGEEITYLSN